MARRLPGAYGRGAWQAQLYAAAMAYGGGNNEPGLRYQEVLMARYTELLLVDGGAAVGDALVAAKRSYVDGWAGAGSVGAQGPNAFQVKTAVGTVLYGLPMYRLVAGGGAEH